MELEKGWGRAAAFIARSKVLTRPFVLVDIGARGGIDARWWAFESSMQVFGFDAETLVQAPTGRQQFFELAIGERDGRCFLNTPENRYESRVDEQGRPIEMRRLDTLFSEGVIPPADFIKIDVEGLEPQVLAGAQQYLASSNLVGVEVETTFNSSPSVPHSHFAAILQQLIKYGLRVADFACSRPAGNPSLAWPGTCNALFLRDVSAGSVDDPETVLKLIAVADMYDLPGNARALLEAHSGMLRGLIDVERVSALLGPAMIERVVERHIPTVTLGLWSGGKRVSKKVLSLIRSRRARRAG